MADLHRDLAVAVGRNLVVGPNGGAGGDRMKPLSDNQRRCIIEATIDPLVAFRRGFARSKAGPFFDLRTVKSLVNTGALRAVFPMRGRRGLTLTARAA